MRPLATSVQGGSCEGAEGGAEREAEDYELVLRVYEDYELLV
jgi:hypothetical protein